MEKALHITTPEPQASSANVVGDVAFREEGKKSDE
jgi:hypothetical protein